jgi:hypothetical protein
VHLSITAFEGCKRNCARVFCGKAFQVLCATSLVAQKDGLDATIPAPRSIGKFHQFAIDFSVNLNQQFNLLFGRLTLLDVFQD